MGLTFKKDDYLEKRFSDFGLDMPLSETEQQALDARKAAERFLEQEATPEQDTKPKK